MFGRDQFYVIGMYTHTHTYVPVPVPPNQSTAAVCLPSAAYPQVPSHVPVGSRLHGAVPALHHQWMYSACMDEPQCRDNDVCRSPLL